MIIRFGNSPAGLKIYRVTVFPETCKPWGFGKAYLGGEYNGFIAWFFGIAVNYTKSKDGAGS